ncbi:PREDICTED: probable metal-nicotianamine transporter YSL7 [Erythranthe guttata]|uniref:probable metal-nicotianamine transporter YSL7 n=1 Tax=Erythranthe guttata TaxID=4155 RepID=UPI00064D9C03|nr:PREDICTED: probable metal-nicotianamine transporter YSL7 [Erythranthe guttata]|eukprot:XP_012834985.1 PREDICTED: probable metal-nicotianamine transporter YSL7 [Erythranthe guttata]
MSPITAAQAETGNTPINVKQLSIGWMMTFLFTVSFVGLFSIVPLRKVMILRYKLTYPSGTATAYLINSFHTPKGARLAKYVLHWFFSAADGCESIWCEWHHIITKLDSCFFFHVTHRFYFDFSATYVGVGMICPYMVNVSLLIGAILSWGVLWPVIESKKGDWYSAKLPASSLHGIQGYRVFLAIAMMLGDGLFHVVYMVIVTLRSFMQQKSQKELIDESTEIGNYDEKKRMEYFLKDQIPNTVAIAGYVVLAGISIAVIPQIFHQLKWYQVLVAYAIAPILAFCNAYGCGLTDWSLASNYGKIAILVFSSWVGLDQGGVLAGLASCGVMMSIVSTASDLMQDFKTGYLTLSSARSMFFSQVFGTAIGCVLSPLVFWVFFKAYSVGDPEGSYPAPYALMYRGIALLGVEGFSSLPKNCLKLVIIFFFASVVMNLVTEVMKKYETKYRIYRFIPSPMCMAIPFYLGAYFAIDMCIGSLILFVWQRKNKKSAKDFGPAVASGLICGDSLWGIPAAVFALAGVQAPICMKFLSASANNKLDALLAG